MKKLTIQLKATVEANPGMKRNLASLQEGKDFTPRSWLYDGWHSEKLEPDQIRDKWIKILESKLENGSDYEKQVLQFDTSQLTKWGPQGGVEPIQKILDEIVMPTFTNADKHPKAFQSEEWQAAKRAVVRYFKQLGIQSLRPKDYKGVLENMHMRDTLFSNSGWPLFTRRNKPEVISASLQDARTGEWKKYPAIALFRNYNNKTRLVWMFPLSTNIVEGSFVIPFMTAVLNTELAQGFFAPWTGFEAVRDLVSKAYEDGKRVAASDFSSTDAHFVEATSEEVFDVLKELFQFRYREELHESMTHMHNIPLVISEDSMLDGEHGVASGSTWTNFVETIFDFILAEYVKIKTHGTWQGLYAIGDDMSWVAPSNTNDAFEDQLDAIGEEVGQVIKAEKTTNEVNWVKSLQRLFQRGYKRSDGKLRGVYSTVRALKSSVYPERFHDAKKWSSNMFCARQFMILENCVDHPLFEDFVKFVCKGHDDLIPFAQQSRNILNKITAETKVLAGLNPTYNQERRSSSLADFASIQVAAKL